MNEALFDADAPTTRGEVRRAAAQAKHAESCIFPTADELAPASIWHSDGNHMLVHGDALEVMHALPDRSVDVVITDPPYSEQTHSNAKSNRSANGQGVAYIHFDSVGENWLRDAFAEMGRVTRSWVVATVDYRHAFALETNPPPGLSMLRIGVWVKDNPMPSISGDRPGQGWEALVFMHRDDVKPTWNGGGRSSVWRTPSERGAHPTTKPQELLREWVRLFSEPGYLILDPFAGSASTAVAAKFEGRRSMSIERDAQWLPVAVSRLAQDVLFS